MSTTATTLPTEFIHFTNRTDAEAMVAANIIGSSRTIDGAVYAVAVGGLNQPAVQHTLDGEREVAILFTTPLAPDCAYVEECIWHIDGDLPVTTAFIVPAAEAEALLDGTADGLED